MSWVPLNTIDYHTEFWCGTILRMYKAGMNPKVVPPEKDYYDYILTSLPWENEWLALVNITDGNQKAGFAYSGMVPIHQIGKKTVTRKEFEHALGKDLSDWYVQNKKAD